MRKRTFHLSVLAIPVSMLPLLPLLAAADAPADRNAGVEQTERLADGRIRATFDFADAAQFEAWKIGPTDPGKVARWDFGNRPVRWAWQSSKSHVRGNGGYLMLPQRLSAEHAVSVDFVAGLDNGNIHCGLFTGEPSFMAGDGGFYFNAGGCSKSFSSVAEDGEWIARKTLPFQTGLYPIRVTYTPVPDSNDVRLTYAVNGTTYFDTTRPRSQDASQGLSFAFLSGWTGGGYSIDRVTITGTPASAHAAR